MHPLESHTLNLIRRDDLFPAGAPVVLGVSGGADSVALLSVMSHLKELLDISLLAVYVDHGLRPGEAEGEKSYVALLASRLESGFTCIEVKAAEYARTRKLSLEHAARDLRYDALRRVSAECGASIIVTAHTADDQAEEILIRLLRGSGRKGMSGMQTKSDDIVRPFLETEKKHIIDYLAEKNIRFMEDSSNIDPRFLRNRVRHELIPFLEQRFDPGIKQALRKTASILAEDEKVLNDLTARAYVKIITVTEPGPEESRGRLVLERKSFRLEPEAVQRRLVEKILWQVGSRSRYAHIMQVVEAARKGRTGSEIHLARGLRVGVQKQYLEFVYPEGRRPWRGRFYRE